MSTSLPIRRHCRAVWHDYNGGVYFVTVCTYGKIHYFGKIDNGIMQLSPLGNEAANQLLSIGSHHKGLDIMNFVVMPNHIHAIIAIDYNIQGGIIESPLLAYTLSSLGDASATPRRGPTLGGRCSLLANAVGGVKAGVKRWSNKAGVDFRWQSGFHDRIIRNQKEYDLVYKYIEENVIRWDKDCSYS